MDEQDDTAEPKAVCNSFPKFILGLVDVKPIGSSKGSRQVPYIFLVIRHRLRSELSSVRDT
jgi:hypothetical protein